MTTPDPSYATQSVVTDPGEMTALLDAALPSVESGAPASDRIAAIRRIANGLIIHYRDPALARADIPKEREQEIGTRYADRILNRISELDSRPLTVARDLDKRMVGCCRDWTVIALSLFRRAGIPARGRVGFAAYFAPGWWIDHEIAEVWDETEGRWRLVDAQVGETVTDPATGETFDSLDLPQQVYLTGPAAWFACRSGQFDPERFAVAPEIPEPFLRSWFYLRHNVIQDLAALSRREQLLWDIWGILTPDPPTPEHQDLLDRVAAITSQPDVTVEQIADLSADPRLGVPPIVTSINPTTGQEAQVTLR